MALISLKKIMPFPNIWGVIHSIVRRKAARLRSTEETHCAAQPVFLLRSAAAPVTYTLEGVSKTRESRLLDTFQSVQTVVVVVHLFPM